MPLSNVLEWIIEFTASVTSAAESIMTGVLPAPTPSAGFPEEYAALTIPGPPVARMMSASRMARFVLSRLGSSMHAIMSFGAPDPTAASSTTLAAAAVQRFALGCGLIRIAFRVFSAISVLNIVVEVGLVVGITAVITPTGSAVFTVPAARFSSITPQVFVSLYAL